MAEGLPTLHGLIRKVLQYLIIISWIIFRLHSSSLKLFGQTYYTNKALKILSWYSFSLTKVCVTSLLTATYYFCLFHFFLSVFCQRFINWVTERNSSVVFSQKKHIWFENIKNNWPFQGVSSVHLSVLPSGSSDES